MCAGLIIYAIGAAEEKLPPESNMSVLAIADVSLFYESEAMLSSK
jgi:hypothetical protein